MATSTLAKPAAKKAANNVVPIKARPDTTGTLIDRMWAKRDEKRKLDEQVKTIEGEMKELEEQLFEKMGTEGLEKATGKAASASITSAVTASVDDWDAFNAYVKKTGYFHLYQRRVSDPAFRELLDAGKKVPGAQPFTKKRLNLRSLA